MTAEEKEDVTCPPGHKFMIRAGNPMLTNSGHTSGWTDQDDSKVASLGMLRAYSSDQVDFQHAIFLICPTCGMVFKQS